MDRSTRSVGGRRGDVGRRHVASGRCPLDAPKTRARRTADAPTARERALSGARAGPFSYLQVNAPSGPARRRDPRGPCDRRLARPRAVKLRLRALRGGRRRAARRRRRRALRRRRGRRGEGRRQADGARGAHAHRCRLDAAARADDQRPLRARPRRRPQRRRAAPAPPRPGSRPRRLGGRSRARLRPPADRPRRACSQRRRRRAPRRGSSACRAARSPA